MSQIAREIKAMVATAATPNHRMVKLTAGVEGEVTLLGASDTGLFGVSTREAFSAGDDVPVAFNSQFRTHKIEMSSSVAVHGVVYAAADGKGASSGTVAVGTAMEAASGSGSIIEVNLDAGTGSASDADSIANYDAVNNHGIPFVQTVTITNTSGGAETTTDALVAPRKCIVIDAFMHARDTQAANVTLDNATTDFTSAVAKGTTDDAKVNFDLDDAATGIASGADIGVTLSADGVVDITLVCIPVA